MECVCDYDPPSVYQAETISRARKEHTCFECGGPIAVGDKYERVFGIWEGRADTFKTCSRCLELRDFITANVPCFCWAHGNVIEDSMECAEQYHEQGNGLLFGAYRRKIKILGGKTKRGAA